MIDRLRPITQFFSLLIANLGIFRILETGIVCPGFYCYACPAAAFACPIGALQTSIVIGSPFPFYLIGSLGLFALLLGRFWCGWFCPFGTLQDIFARLRRRKDITILPPVPVIKYLSLAVIMIIAAIWMETLFCKVCPSGSLFGAIPQELFVPSEEPDTFIPSGAESTGIGTFFYVHLATLAVSLILFYLFGRFWCRYLCPLGAIHGFFNRISFIKVRLDEAKCTGCKICLDKCPVNLSETAGIGNSTDCIQCGRCISDCPSDAIHISASLKI